MEVLAEEWDRARSDPAEAPLSVDEERKLEVALPDAGWIIQNYVSLNRGARVLLSEVWFEDLIGGVRFSGTIDQVRATDRGDLLLVDLKTDRQAPTQAFLDRSIQFSLYAHAVRHGVLLVQDERVHIGESVDLAWYQLGNLIPNKRGLNGASSAPPRDDPMIPILPKSDEDLERIEEELLLIVSGIESGFFPMNPQKLGTCSWCPFAGICDRSEQRQLHPSLEERL